MTVVPIPAALAGSDSARILAGADLALRRIAGPLAVLLSCTLDSTGGLVHPRFVPSPLTVLRALQEWMFGQPGAGPYSGTWFTHAGNSAYRVFIGFLLLPRRVLVGCLIGWSRLMSDLLDPIIQIVRPIPITAWVPFAVIFLGIRDASAFFLIALGAFFPVVVDTAGGRASAPQASGARRAHARKCVFHAAAAHDPPRAMPLTFTGLRLGVGLASVLVVVGEDGGGRCRAGLRNERPIFYVLDVVVASHAQRRRTGLSQ